jgi:hypothetical protein
MEKKDYIDADVIDDRSNQNSTSKSIYKFLNEVDNWNIGVKMILCIPFVDIFWVIYRLLKSIADEDVVGIIIAILVLVFGIWFLWIVDMLSVAFKGHILWFNFKK